MPQKISKTSKLYLQNDNEIKSVITIIIFFIIISFPEMDNLSPINPHTLRGQKSSENVYLLPRLFFFLFSLLASPHSVWSLPTIFMIFVSARKGGREKRLSQRSGEVNMKKGYENSC